MRKGIIITAILLATSPLCLAQRKATMTYGADFQYYFDNREYDRGGNQFESSGTIHAARLTPSVGVAVKGGNFTHNLALGVDVM